MMMTRMTAEMRAEFGRSNADRLAHGEPTINEDEFVFVWEIGEQWGEREESLAAVDRGEKTLEQHWAQRVGAVPHSPRH